MLAATAPAMADHTFQAMGTTARIVTDAPGPAALEAVARVHDLEQRWSRFLETSEISGLNANAGHPTIVSAETFDLVDRACLAWRETDGRFDPTVLHELTELGYDRDHRLLQPPAQTTDTEPPSQPSRTSRCGDITLEPGLRAITLPPGIGFDPGGIGKGLAADLVANDLVVAGASWAVVNLGGDMRFAGERLAREGWEVTITGAQERLDVYAGGVATSSLSRRRWHHNGADRHHLLNPATGKPARSALNSATVQAGEAWWAEIVAKVLVIDPTVHNTDLFDRWNVQAMVFKAESVG